MVAGSKTFGTQMVINQSQPIGNNDEIPSGDYALVVGKSNYSFDSIPLAKWNQFLNGDLSLAAQAIENGIPHSKAVWISTHWDNVAIDPNNQGGMAFVYGFTIEALVQNTGGAAQTGAEIFIILIGVAILAAVLAGIAVTSWVTVQVMNATKALGPAVTVGVGVLILLGLFILIFVVLGGSASYKGKKRSLRVGKGG